MINIIFQFKRFFKLLIFIPIIFYFGKRSYLAYDEGFYALQARWILDNGNWTMPLWFEEYILDRTIGLQFLIAKSQEIFGRNIFWAYLPTTIAAIIMLFLTFKLHEELIDKKFAFVSPLILSTTYLWFDYSHLGTQDIIFSCLVTFGIFSLAKIKSRKNKLYILFFGIWIGLAFMMKTFLVAVPLLSLLPYLIIRNKLFLSIFFWFGLLIGFIPFLIWTFSINQYLDQNIIFHLLEKFKILSNKNDSSNPFYYYFWNIPITFLPWSIFSIIGLLTYKSENKDKNFILTFFPLTFILIISLFSTKTPYYPLQISSILTLNSFLGIKYLFKSKFYKSIFIFIISKIIPLLLIFIACGYYFFFKNITSLNFKENTYLFIGLILFGLTWTFLENKTNFKNFLIILIIGPYLLTSFILGSGLFTDRSRELRETMEYVSSLDIVKNQIIKVDKSGINNEEAHSKIIRISILTPNLGEGLNNINDLNPGEVAWYSESSNVSINDKSFKVLYKNSNLKPWKLILKR
tara:strand:- start:2784 stop:4337 length:1554 start_codon:yes stop_codon:yes gene_type:complete